MSWQKIRPIFVKAYAEAFTEEEMDGIIANGNSFEPALHFGAPDLHGGFVYSPDEINLSLLRVTRLEEARARFNRAA